MSVFKSDGIAQGNPHALLDGVAHGGTLRVNICKYTLAAASVTGDQIELCRLPAGSKLITGMCWAAGGGSGSTVKLVGRTAAQAYGTFTPTSADEAVEDGTKVLAAELGGTAVASGTTLVFGIVWAAR